MNRPFALPIAVALSFHAFLFLGFTRERPEKTSPAKPKNEPASDIVICQFQEEVQVSDAPTESRPKVTVSAPSLPEPPAAYIAVDRLPISVMPFMPELRPQTLSTIPLNPPGNDFFTEGKGNGPQVFKLSSLDNPPRTKLQVPPRYPAALKAAGVQGEVSVEFLVSEQGRVLDACVLRSSQVEFEEPALHAVRQWVFEPGKRAGRAVRFQMNVPIVFSLTKDN